MPKASNEVEFQISGNGKIVGVDNGDQISHEPFKANKRRAFNGKCLVVVQATEREGKIISIPPGPVIKILSAVSKETLICNPSK
ncbi:MAG: hypothetical protein P8X70_00405 [Nanoarchaeota archaeon]